MKTILAYIIAVIFAACIGYPFLIIVVPAAAALRRVKAAALVFFFLIEATKLFTAVFLTKWFCGLLSVEPAKLMVIIPGFLIIKNAIWRIKRAELGLSNVRMMMELDGEGPFYNQTLDIKVEFASFLGAAAGLALGLADLFPNAPFY